MFDWRKQYEEQMLAYNLQINWEVMDFLPNGREVFENSVAEARLRIVDLLELIDRAEDPVEKMLHERDLVHLLVIDDLGEKYEAITQLLEEV